MSFYWLFLMCTVSYFIGNINFSILISKYVLKNDIRKGVSGNAGAANMVRSFGLKWGVIILVADMLKGAVPALAGLLLYGFGTHDGGIAMYACGLAAVIGHCYPAVFKFKGGKGVATTLGVFFIANPILVLIVFSFAFLYASFYRYSSVASMVLATSMMLWEGFMKTPGATVCILLLCFYVLILFLHRANIWRIIKGQENRVFLFAKIQKKKNRIKQEKWLAEENAK